MSERDRRIWEHISDESTADPREERLRVLCAAAYDPVKPSEALRRKVAEVSQLQDTRSRCPAGPWWVPAMRWAPAAGILAAVLLLVLGLTLVRSNEHRSTGGQTPLIVVRQPPKRDIPAPHFVSQHPRRNHGQQIAQSQRMRTLPEDTRPNRLSFASYPKAPVAGDLDRVNRGPEAAPPQWVPVRREERDEIEERVRRAVPVRDDFVRIPFPRIASIADRQIAEAVESYKREAAIVDARLAHPVTLQQKATALSDLCERLRADTGIQLGAGSSVADEKVTVFCEKMPLRDVMRQLSRPFGYTWLRSTRNGQYHYELMQDLRSQLLEEELRNRDRYAALLALDRDVERYRKYLSLSPVEAEARLKTAPETEKPLLEKLGSRDGDGQFGLGWGPIQMYFRLSRAEQEALRAGQELVFTTKPEPGERRLPPDVARGVLQSYRDWRVHIAYEVWDFAGNPASPEDRPLTAVPEVCAGVSLWITQSDLGTLTLDGRSRIFFPKGAGRNNGTGPYATGRSPAVVQPENDRLSARFAGDPALRPLVTVRPQPSYRPVASADGAAPPEPKVTPADLLEAFHRATGLPVVGDYYTRLYPPADVSVANVPLYQALNQLADAMRLRWTLADGHWLQFRSASYYDDRLKEVPNRLLAGWSAARRQKGFLSLDDLVEIAGLPDAQLDGAEMAEGAREIWGLKEWELPCNGNLRPHLRDLALFTPEQRQQAMMAGGLPFVKMTLPQQQHFINHATLYDPLPLEVLAGAALRVDYTRPGEFQWGDPGMVWSWTRWFVIREPGRHGSWAPRPSVRARTREGVVEALLRLDPAIRDGATHRHPLRAQELASAPPAPVPLEAQIFPTDLNLVFVYIPSRSNESVIQIMHRYGQSGQILF
jgi:hypothetical protein